MQNRILIVLTRDLRKSVEGTLVGDSDSQINWEALGVDPKEDEDTKPKYIEFPDYIVASEVARMYPLFVDGEMSQEYCWLQTKLGETTCCKMNPSLIHAVMQFCIGIADTNPDGKLMVDYNKTLDTRYLSPLPYEKENE